MRNRALIPLACLFFGLRSGRHSRSGPACDPRHPARGGVRRYGDQQQSSLLAQGARRAPRPARRSGERRGDPLGLPRRLRRPDPAGRQRQPAGQGAGRGGASRSAASSARGVGISASARGLTWRRTTTRGRCTFSTPRWWTGHMGPRDGHGRRRPHGEGPRAPRGRDPRPSILYYQGPLLAPADDPKIPDYEVLGRFDGEIAKKGVPTGVMKGTTAIAAAPFESGRVLCISPHPERTDNLHDMVYRRCSG